jgi:plastocyanin
MAASITVVESGTEIPRTQVEPTPAPAEPTLTATEAPPAPGTPSTFDLDMIDSSFSVLNLEVPAGSTVTWTNAGNARHSATADDGSFDTGLISSGEKASITFETPGVYTYFCILHGAAGGVGMTAVITVTG